MPSLTFQEVVIEEGIHVWICESATVPVMARGGSVDPLARTNIVIGWSQPERKAGATILGLGDSVPESYKIKQNNI